MDSKEDFAEKKIKARGMKNGVAKKYTDKVCGFRMGLNFYSIPRIFGWSGF